jgi:hypothetical protein
LSGQIPATPYPALEESIALFFNLHARLSMFCRSFVDAVPVCRHIDK